MVVSVWNYDYFFRVLINAGHFMVDEAIINVIIVTTNLKVGNVDFYIRLILDNNEEGTLVDTKNVF